MMCFTWWKVGNDAIGWKEIGIVLHSPLSSLSYLKVALVCVYPFEQVYDDSQVRIRTTVMQTNVSLTAKFVSCTLHEKIV